MWRRLFETDLLDVRVPEVLAMLSSPSLPVWKRLPLALIALVDGVIVCGHKLLRVTPSYVEMVEDTGAFLEYSWGREAFLATLPRLVPPPAATPAEKVKSLEIMRLRLQQKTAACYGFPLALQLMALKAIPALIERIPEPDKLSNFLEEPDGCNARIHLLNFEDIIEVEAVPELCVAFSLPEEGVEITWEDEIEDPKIEKLIELMRGGYIFKGMDFIGGDASLPPLNGSSKVTGAGDPDVRPDTRRRFPKQSEETGCSSDRPRRPSRPQRGVGKEPELSKSGEIIEEVKIWFRVELSAQLGKLREEIYAWTHPNESCSSPGNGRGRTGTHHVPQSEAFGNDTGGVEPKKRKFVPSDGFEQADNAGCVSKKHRSDMSNNDIFVEVAQPDIAFNSPNIANANGSTPPDEPVLSNDASAFATQSAEPTTLDTVQGRHKFSVEEVPMAGLDLLASMGGYFVEDFEEVQKEAEDVGQSEHHSMAIVLYGKPKAYVLASEVCDESDNDGNSAPISQIHEQNEAASPTNSEDYRTPPEDEQMSDFRTPDLPKAENRRYLTRSAKIQESEGKSSKKLEKGKGKRIRKRSNKVGGVYIPDRRLKELFLSCPKPKYTPLAEVDVKMFKQFRKILLENTKQ